MLGLLLLAVAPSLFIFLYLYRKDRYEPEPLRLVIWIFFLGTVAVIPAAFIELLFPSGIFVSAVVAPVVEEAIKFLVVFLTIYRNPEFDEPVDGIVYAMAAGLGFATLENILYVLEGGLMVGIVRAIASVPGHVVFSCIWGFALGTAKFRPEEDRTGIILVGLAGAILMHGIFNFSLEAFDLLGLLLILVLIVPFGWWMTCRNIRCSHADPSSASSVQEHLQSGGAAGVVQGTMQNCGMKHAYSSTRESGQKFCTNCGFPVKTGIRFCENCGQEADECMEGSNRTHPPAH